MIMIVLIRGFDSYRDGGTISIQCHGYIGDGKSQQFELCLDNRLESLTPAFWIGYPGKETSTRISDPATIEHVIEKVADFKRYQNFRIDEVLSGLKTLIA